MPGSGMPFRGVSCRRKSQEQASAATGAAAAAAAPPLLQLLGMAPLLPKNAWQRPCAATVGGASPLSWLTSEQRLLQHSEARWCNPDGR